MDDAEETRLYTQFVTTVIHYDAGKLCSIVGDDDAQQSEPTHDFLPIETMNSSCCNLSSGLYIYPFCEVVDPHN